MGKGRGIKKNMYLLKLFFDGEVPTAIKLEGGGGLMALPFKKDFFAASQRQNDIVLLEKS